MRLARSLRYFFERILSTHKWAASSGEILFERELRNVGSAQFERENKMLF